MVYNKKKYDWKFVNNYKYSNNKKLATIIRYNMKIIEGYSKLEQNLAKDVCKDIPISKIAKRNNISKDKAYNILFRNNGKSLLTRLY